MQAILPQALREEIEILLGKEYIEGWESEIVANNKRNIEGFKKYNIILNEDIFKKYIFGNNDNYVKIQARISRLFCLKKFLCVHISTGEIL